jgi:hypothetical protein
MLLASSHRASVDSDLRHGMANELKLKLMTIGSSTAELMVMMMEQGYKGYKKTAAHLFNSFSTHLHTTAFALARVIKAKKQNLDVLACVLWVWCLKCKSGNRHVVGLPALDGTENDSRNSCFIVGCAGREARMYNRDNLWKESSHYGEDVGGKRVY